VDDNAENARKQRLDFTILIDMETTIGPLGFTIPTQTLTRSEEVNMTPTDVMAWRNHLPMADLGAASKKVYHAISDCNKVKIIPKDRFEILELFRPLIQFICQSLNKHYINQAEPLTKQQLIIANLAQTLQLEMANGYKLLVEQLVNQDPTELQASIVPIALQRIVHYFTHIILRNYHLYAQIPAKIWKELYLIYQFAEKNQYLQQNNLVEEYKRILLLASTFPYQWRQSEQEAIYRATETWSFLGVIRDDFPDAENPGFLIIDFADDHPPLSPCRGLIKFSTHCKILDVNKILEHIKKLLIIIEPNELKSRIAHSNEPEYTVSTTVLRRLIKEWGASTSRFQERKQRSEPVKICVGLTATHYYLNGERLFQLQATNVESDTFTLLPLLGLQEETSGANEGDGKASFLSDKITTYPVYSCTLVNESSYGYGLLWQGETYPPIQAGELIGIVKQTATDLTWEVGVVRWLQQQTNTEFRLGIEHLAKTAKASSAQLVKEGQAAGYFLRCLMLEDSVLTPILPFKSGSQVNILQNGDPVNMEIELTKLIDSTASYKRFEFITKQIPEIKPPNPEGSSTSNKKEEINKKSDNASDSFDSIWSNL
jgi:hypothetical protein